MVRVERRAGSERRVRIVRAVVAVDFVREVWEKVDGLAKGVFWFEAGAAMRELREEMLNSRIVR